MKWNYNTFKNDNLILFEDELISNDVLSEYKAFFKECNELLKKVSNYFDNTERLKGTELVSMQQIEELINKSNEKDIWLDNEEDINSKIIITEKNNIKKEIEITHHELLVLKLATLHNSNIVNLMSKTKEIKSLLNKGLLNLSSDGSFVVVNKIVEIIIKTNTSNNSMVIANDNSTDGSLKNEIVSDGCNENVVRFEWDIKN